MKLYQVGKTDGGQDGAIFAELLFRFDTKGICKVYDLSELDLSGDRITELSPISKFTLDRRDYMLPHSNAVVFGREYYAEGDEFPLLYSNIYNNYQREADKRCGICCVYRLTRAADGFKTELVQTIGIGFTDSAPLWRSAEGEDIRPYGNFVIDRENGRYYAFTMRDGDRTTRYFEFELPRLCDGEIDCASGIRRVTLTEQDIKAQFDAPYHHFIQGACHHRGRIYSVEGFTRDEQNPPAIRVIDVEKRCQESVFYLSEIGLDIEPELIDFSGETCFYGDGHGNLFVVK